MSLTIFSSDKIEDLASVLSMHLSRKRKEDHSPFSPLSVIVPNGNIAKWLQIRIFSKEPLLCAGIDFPFMEKRFMEIMSANLPAGSPFSRLGDNEYSTEILKILLEDGARELDPFRSYFSSGGRPREKRIFSRREAAMAWQLAAKLADLMDKYEVHRPEIVSSWLRGVNSKGGVLSGIEGAEAYLAGRLWGAGGAFDPAHGRNSMRQLYDRVKDKPPRQSDETVFLFGQSILSDLQVKILLWLAQSREVVLFHNNICREYWGDIETDREIGRAELYGRLGKAQSHREDVDVDNDLLRQWGSAGRETMRLIVTLEEESSGKIDFAWYELRHFEPSSGKTVLEKVQSSVRRRTCAIERTVQDASIQIVGAPDIRREVEMVHNAIIGSVWKPDGSGQRPWSDCTFSDIAVLVPDMAKYRPVIESVFDARATVPYGLVDASASGESLYLAGFLSLAELGRSGLDRKRLFAVLDNPCVQEAMSFTAEDVREWRRLTDRNLGAYSGFSLMDGDDNKFFSWDWALSRMRLGMVAGDGPFSGEDGTEIPLAGQGNGGELKFSEVVETLYRVTRAAFFDASGKERILPLGSHAGPSWKSVLLPLMDEFLAIPGNDRLEEAVRRKIAGVIGACAGMGEIECNFELPVAAAAQFAGGISCRRGGYLTHGITVASLQPMRPVPFKQVFVLGMGAGSFPGRSGLTTLDIRGAEWKLGDVSLPKLNRFLFLELLMSVRERLVISYPNCDLKQDAELFPSGMVFELEDFITRHILPEGAKFSEFRGYPLLEHGETQRTGPECVDDARWEKDDPFAGILPTYSAAARREARRRRAPQGGTEPPLTDGAGAAAASGAKAEITPRMLQDFLLDPFKAVLRHSCKLGINAFLDETMENLSPLDIGSAKKQVLREFFREAMRGADAMGAAKKATRTLQMEGRMPCGYAMDIQQEELREELEALWPLAEAARGAVLNMEMADNAKAQYCFGYRGQRVSICAERSGLYVGRDGTVAAVAYAKSKKAPPPFALEPFFSWLVALASGECSGNRFRLIAVDLDEGAISAWEWDGVTMDEAKDYLESLCADYLEMLAKPDADGLYGICKYGDFAEKAQMDGVSIDWDGLFAGMRGGDSWRKGRDDYSLSVRKNLEKHERFLASAAELEDFCRRRYDIVMRARSMDVSTLQNGASAKGGME